MRGIWTVARHTFAQAVRMKVAVMFVLMLVVALVVLPLVMEGDGTLSGRIRTFLSYSTSITAGLLSLVTIFVSTAVITSDVRGKQVFSVVTKPVARWQYVLGRWLGVVLLDAILLLAAASANYALAEHMRSGEALNQADRCGVETEIFTARVRISPDSFVKKLNLQVKRRIEEMKDNRRSDYENAMRDYLQEADGNEREAYNKLYADIAKQQYQAMQSVVPGGSLSWEFSGITLSEKSYTGNGRVQVNRPGLRHMLIKADPALLSRLIYGGPVRVNGADARVLAVEEGRFVALFTTEDAGRKKIAALSTNDEVPLEIDPTIQLTYKASPGGKAPGDVLRCNWYIVNPTDGYMHWEPPRNDPVRLPATLAISARAVDPEGKMIARYVNRSPTSVNILHDDISVLYRVGSFELNFARVILLIGCQLAFLAALGVLAGTFLSFPVACLMSLASLPFSLGRDFIADSVQLRDGPISPGDIFSVLGDWILKVMSVLLPNFSDTSRGDSLVEGIYVSWSSMGATAAVVVGIQTAMLLAIACLIFHKRELARVQI